MTLARPRLWIQAIGLLAWAWSAAAQDAPPAGATPAPEPNDHGSIWEYDTGG